ncbi:MAG TPA: hypothetical protein VHJ34_02240 [Actinomycetota bacterium]|nr:hypothetical protein [Actinomycetota bacterium]
MAADHHRGWAGAALFRGIRHAGGAITGAGAAAFLQGIGVVEIVGDESSVWAAALGAVAIAAGIAVMVWANRKMKESST